MWLLESLPGIIICTAVIYVLLWVIGLYLECLRFMPRVGAEKDSEGEARRVGSTPDATE